LILISRSFHRKLAVMFTVAIMLLIGLSSTITYWKFHSIISQQVLKDFNQLMIQNKLNINNLINSLDKATLLLYTDQTIMNILNKQPAGYLEYMATFNDVNQLNNEMTKYVLLPLTSSLNTSSISFFVSPDMPFASALNSGENFFFGFYNGKEIVSTPWYKQSIEADGRLIWFKVDGQPNELFVARLIKNPEALDGKNTSIDNNVIKNVGVVVIGFNLSEITKQLEASDLSPSTQLVITDQNGILLYSKTHDGPSLPIHDYLSRPVGEVIRYQSSDYLLTRNSLLFDWKLTGLIPLDEITNKSTFVKYIVGSTALIAVFAGGLLAAFISNQISSPLRRLARAMKTIMITDHLNVTLELPRSQDEIGILFKSFNGMMRRTQHLMAEVYESGVRLKETELKALQAQINPHFLYNTLDSVNWLALESGADQIVEINSSLSNMFRYIAKDADELVTLAEEMQQVKHYMTIQSHCYPGRFDYHFDLPPEFISMRCPKLIFQPLVENAILHGIEKTNRKGLIQLNGTFKRGTAMVSISDNGVGDDAKELNVFLEGKNNSLRISQGFGIRNVHRRIQLKYGEAYGLRYETNEWGGLTAVIRLPIQAPNGNSLP
jgi:two-component system sensor histidine kinase YesM